MGKSKVLNSAIANIYSLTPLQEGMLYHKLLEEQSSNYVIQNVFSITGEIDKGKMKQALELLMLRHDVLRTSFVYEKVAKPVQVVLHSREADFEIIDVQMYAPAIQEKKVREIQEADVKRGFDLQKETLLRVKLIQLGPDNHKLIWSLHHIIMDGWCTSIIFSDFMRYYEALSGGTSVSQMKTQVEQERSRTSQYGEYVRWLEQQDKQKGIRYWKELLEDYDGQAEIEPMIKPDSSELQMDSLAWQLPDSVSERLFKMAADHKATMNTLAETAWALLLQQYCRTDDVVFGKVVSGRSADIRDIENIAGLFINTIPIRVQTDPGMTIAELVERVQNQATDSSNYDYCSLADIQKLTRQGSDLIKTLLVFENYYVSEENESDLKDASLQINMESGREQTNYAINISFNVGAKQLAYEIMYDPGKYEKSEIIIISNHLQQLFLKFADGFEQMISDLNVITPEEETLILETFNNTDTQYPKDKTVLDLLETQAEMHPDKIAVIFEEEAITFSELNNRANALAYRLRGLGIKPDDFVAIITEKSIELIIGLYGIMKSGAAYVPIDSEYPKDRIEYIISDCQPKAIVVGQVLPDVDIPVVHLADFGPEKGIDKNPDKVLKPNNLIYSIYTSGTTGKPKGVLVEHGNVVADIYQFTRFFGVSEKTISLQQASFAFDMFTEECYPALCNGGTIAISQKERTMDAVRLCEYINEKKINLVHVSPLLAREIDRLNCLHEVDTYIIGSDRMRMSHISNLLKEDAGIYQGYGPTEGTVLATRYQIKGRYEKFTGDIHASRVPIGKPKDNCKVYILNGNQMCGLGVPGELCISGAGITRGYLNKPELTDEKFVPNPWGAGKMYRTGDLARWLPDGNIEFLGRIDEQVKIRGFRIELGEIEAVLRKQPGISDVAVIVREYHGENYLCGYYIAEQKVTVRTLKEGMKKELPDYMIPAYMMQVDEIPMTRNGKLDKGALPEIILDEKQEYIPPVNDVQEKLCALFEEVLEVKHVGIRDDFFSLGGHSLKVARLVNRIEVALGVKIALKNVFTYTTVEALSTYIMDVQHGGQESGITVAEKKPYYPMSSAQKRMYLIQQMDEDSIVYNMPHSMHLSGEILPDRIRSALQALVDRHEILRTSFDIVDGVPVQIIHDQVEVDFVYVEDKNQTSEALMKEFVRPFDLSKPSMLRAVLVKREDEFMLMLDIHHIISDGASDAVFIREFNELYQGNTLPALKYQYKDYSEWMNRRDMSAQKSYWMREFQDEIPVLDMPYDYKRPQKQSYHGQSVIVEAGKELTEKITALAKRYDATEYMIFMAATMILLQKYSRQDDIVIGSPVSARTIPEVENMLGMFANTLAIRAYPQAEKKIEEFLGEVRDVCLKAYENQEYPFEELIENVNVNRDLSRSPLFDVMLVMQNNDVESYVLEQNSVGAETEAEVFTAKFDLTFSVIKDKDEFFIGLQYCIDLFRRKTAEDMVAHLIRVLEQMVDDIELSIADIDTASHKEKQLILEKFNHAEANYPKEKTIVDLFEEQVERTPNNIAVTCESEKITYRQLNASSNRLAWELRDSGVGTDDFVVILAQRSIEMIIGIYGVLKAGGAYVPIDPGYPKDRIAYTIKDCKPKAVIVFGAYDMEFPDDVKIIDLKDYKNCDENMVNLPHINHPQDIAYVIYTSGTTGRPKGVMVKHVNVVRLMKNDQFRFDFNETDVWMMFHSYCFDFSVWEMYGATLYGGTLVMITKEAAQDSKLTLNCIKENNVTVLNQVPSAFYNLMRVDEDSMSSVRYLIFGGEALQPDKLSGWHQKYPMARIVNMYGITETTVHVTYREIEDREIERGVSDIGSAIPTLAVYVMNGNAMCGIGIPGELCVTGDGLARGYLNRDELTAEKFVPNPYGDGRMYRSGDLARWLPDGNLEYMGRIDEQVKIRGFRIELGEISSVIRKQEFVQDCAVIVREKNNDKSICAYIVSDKNVDMTELRELLRKDLPEYMIPAYYMQIDKLPVTRNGKLNKKALPEIVVKTEKEYIAPASKLQKAVCNAFGKVLEVERVGLKDDFFALGGHSLKATILANELESQTGVRIPLKVIFSEPTPKGVAEYIEHESGPGYAGIPFAEEKDYYPMSSTQKRIYLIWQMDPSSVAYNMPKTLKLTGDICAEDVKNAFDQLVERHEILRTNFKMVEDVLVQEIHAWREIEFNYFEDAVTSEETLINQFIAPFDLTRDILLRVCLVKRQSEHLLMIDTHHIISDGVSDEIFTREFNALYNKQSLPPLTHQYKDYSEWMRSRDLSSQKAYWMSQFDDEIPLLDMPLDYPRPQEQSYRGGIVGIYINDETGNRLRGLMKATGSTEYMIFLSTFMVVLSKYSRQDDIVVGSPISARVHKDTQDMLGMFVNTLAMRGRPEKDKSFEQFLLEMKDVCLKAYENQEYPFEELVEAVNVRRDLSRNPLFDVMLTYHNNKEEEFALGNLGVEDVGEKTEVTAKFDLSVDAGEMEGHFAITMEYCADLFTKETCELLLAHFSYVLDQVTADPAIRIGSIDTVTEQEKNEILPRFNNTAAFYPDHKTVVTLLEEQALRRPDALAVVFAQEQLTFGELNTKANVLGDRLRSMGVKPGDFVGIMAERSLEMIVAIYGVLKSGGAYLPIDTHLPEERIRFMLEDSQAKLLLTYHVDVQTDIPVFDLANEEVWNGKTGNPDNVNQPTDLAYMIYTSGTTGKPKGVLIEHRGLINLLESYEHIYDMREDDIVLQFASYCFDQSVWDIFSLTWSGNAICVIPEDYVKDPDKLTEYANEKHITIASFTPAYINVLKPEEFPTLRLLDSSGEAGNLPVLHKWCEGRRVINTYGPTEVTVNSSSYEVTADSVLLPIGGPIDNLQFYVLDGNHLCGVGVPGELCIAGVGVARGYLNRDELTREKFVKNPFGEGNMYRSGDLVRWMPDGNIDYMGRMDEQVKIRGFRIELGEIVTVINQIPEVENCAVIARQDHLGEKAIFAYMVSAETLDFMDIRERLSETLPEYMIPAYMMQIDDIPVTRNGKLDRRALPEIKVKTGKIYVSPSTVTEKKICGIFQEILGIQEIGIRDSFFDLGGHSLRATKLVNRIAEETGVAISLKDVFNSSTVEGIAKLVDAGTSGTYVPIPRAEEKELYYMSSAQRRTYLVQQLDPSSVAYNMVQNMRLIGEVNPEGIQAALQQMTERHEILRTVFLMVDGEPMQKILPKAEVDFVYEEDCKSTEEELKEAFVKPFDLQVAPLVRAKLVKRADDHLLMIDMHHIIGDGMSDEIFINEFNALYKGEILEPLTCQYKDYSEWMRTRDLSDQRAYWVSEFSDEIPVLDMPTDYPRPLKQSFRGMVTGVATGRKLGEKIKKLARENHATEYMVFLSAAMILLGKYSRQEDIVIGSPISGRTHRDTEKMLGMFINTLAMRGKPEKQKTYREFLHEICDTCMKAYENQEYPFEQLIEDVDVQRDLSRNPLFDVMLVLQNNEDVAYNFGDTKIENIGQESKVAKFDMTFNIFEENGDFGIALEYCSDLFKKESMERLLAHFIQLLEQITKKDTETIGLISVVPDSEQKQIISVFNNTEKAFEKDKTIAELFDQQAKKYPGHIAVIYKERQVTYLELNRMADAVSFWLRQHGVCPGDYVGLLAQRGVELVAGMYGIMKAGAAYVPIDPTYPEERIRFMLEDCKPKMVLTYKAQFDTELPVMDLESDEIYMDAPEEWHCVNHVDNTAYVIYTSGTTGKPKGVMVGNRGVANLKQVFNVNANDRVLQFANFIFDASVLEFNMSLLNGATLVMMPAGLADSTEEFVEFVKEQQITVAVLPPNYYSQVLEIGPKLLITGGSEAGKYMVENSRAECYINGYGPTETTVCSTSWCSLEGIPDSGVIPIGKPVYNMQNYIMNGDMLCGIGMPGELCIGGVGVALGYLNREELTAEKFVKNPFGEGMMYRSGDLARWKEDGNLEYLGRIDEQVKVRGYRIELGEIETVLRKMKGILDAAVITRTDKTGENAIYAYYTADRVFGVSEIKEELARELPEYMIPAFMMQLDRIPVTRNGKVDRRMLPEIEASAVTEYVAPANETERCICEVFKEVLGVKNIGVYDGFFDMGGDSIKAIRAVSKLREKQVHISVKDIMTYKTVRAIASMSIQTVENSYQQSAVTGTVELTPIMKWLLSADMPKFEHFNQSIMLAADKFDREALKSALDQLVIHHDMLRAVYYDGRLKIRDLDEGSFYDMAEYDVSGIKDCMELAQTIYEIGTNVQKSMNLTNGPLVKTAIFKTAEEEHLLIAVHHLCVDGVSWRIIVDDLKNSYVQAMRKEDIVLPQKTASFKEWSEALLEFGRSETVQNEKAYWKKVTKQLDNAEITVKDTGRTGWDKVSVRLNKEDTSDLIYRSNHAYHTEINDLLMTALGMAVNKTTGNQWVGVRIEGHGREIIHKAIDIDRTIGWFTCEYPVVLKMSEDVQENIIEVKETLRGIPGNGMGYGVLKYEKDSEIEDKAVQICFNYLGNFEEGADEEQSEIIRISKYAGGIDSAPENHTISSLNFNGVLSEGELEFSLEYDMAKYTDDFVGALMNAYKEALVSVAHHCTAKKEQVKTPSDYGLSNISMNDLNNMLEQAVDIYPLTPLQEGMMYQGLAEEQKGAYILQTVYTVKEEMNPSLMKAALYLTCEKYPVLKTRIVGQGLDNYVQMILKEIDCSIKVHDIRGKSQSVLDAIAEDDVKHGFDLQSDAMIRVQLVKIGVKDYRMIVSIHHIIVDGWSMPLITKQLFMYYARLSNGEKKEAILAEIDAETAGQPTYGDYVRWLRKKSVQEGITYWKEQVAEYDTAAGIEPAEQGTVTDKTVMESEVLLSVEDTAQIKTLAGKLGVTVNTIVETAVGLLLQKYNHTEDVVFGKVVSGRNAHFDGIEEMAGLFINTIVKRIQCQPKDTITTLLQRGQKDSIESTKYDYIGLAEIQSVSELKNNLVKTIFAFENYYVSGTEDAEDVTEKSEDEVISIDFSREETNYDISFAAAVSEQLLLKVLYNPDMYGLEDIQRILFRWKLILEQMIMNPDAQVSDVSFVLDDEKQLIMDSFNSTQMSWPEGKTIVELFEEQVALHPDKTAVVFGSESVCYEELNARANMLAHRLREKGVGRDTLVAVIADRSLEMITVIFAVLKAGGAFVPIDPEYPKDRICYMLEDSKPLLVLNCCRSIYGIREAVNFEFMDLYSTNWCQGNAGNPEHINQAHDLAYVIYTSGTTGKPKGVLVEHYGVANLKTYFANIHNVSAEDRVLQFANFSFDASISEITMGILTGAALYIVPDEIKKNTKAFETYVSENSISILILPPQFLAQLHLDGVRTIITAGSETNAGIVAANKHISVYSNDYGPTEATVCATYWKHDSADRVPGRIPIGKPMNNKQIYIMNGNQLCGIGMPGELCIAGVGIARGYLHLPELTAEKFVKNPFGKGRLYRTGDLARWLPDGNLEYLGRIDDQVKIRGFRIELGEIENVIRAQEAVQDVAVIAITDAVGEKALCAYVVSDEKMDTEKLKTAISQKLPEYMMVSYWMQVEKIPVTRNGKLDKRALPAVEVISKTAYVAPEDEIEFQICKLFEEILGVEKVGIYTNFFEMGGHSLRATRLVNQIEAFSGVRIPLKTVFAHAVPKELAEYVKLENGESYIPIPKAEEKDTYEMSSTQKRIYLIWQMDPDSLAYNMSESMRMMGDIDADAVRDVFQAIVDRHEILRTSFHMENGKLIQKPWKDITVDFVYQCYDGKEESEIVAEFTKPFDLERPYLIRGKLVQLEKGCLLLIDMHHIVSDAVSMSNFIKEFNELYNGRELPVLSRQYKDYSEWMRSRDLSSQKAYWTKVFSDEIPVLDLPADYPRPMEQSYNGSMLTAGFGEEISDALNKFISQTESTAYMVFLSAVMVLMSRYSRQEDIVIGSPISARTHKDTENMLGMFINTLAMRGMPKKEKTFREFLGEMKDVCLKVYENQEFPFEELIEAVDVKRDLGRNPLFDVMLVMQNTENEELRLGESRAEYVGQESCVAKFDLTFNFFESNGQFGVSLEYCTDLFKRETIQWMIKHLIWLLGQMLRTPDACLGEFSICLPEEKEQILTKFNDTAVEYDRKKTIVELFEEQAANAPEKVAFVYGERKITYGILNRSANSLAHKLRSMGVGTEDYVMVIARRSLEMIKGIYGVIKSGAAYVPVDPEYPMDRILYMMEDCSPKAVLLYGVQIETDIPVIDLEDENTWNGVKKNPVCLTKPENLLYLIYTSGTTGKPKGVMLQNSSVMNYCAKNSYSVMSTAYEKQYSRMASVTNLTFDIFVTELILPMVNGMTTYLTNEEEQHVSAAFYRFVERNNIEILQTTPSRIKLYLVDKRNIEALRKLKLILLGGEKVEASVVNELKQYTDADIRNVYGPSETTVWSTVRDVCGEDSLDIPVGKPIGNTQVYIMDGDNLCGVGVPGELCIAGDGLARGYLNKTELTAEKFVSNPFGSGKMYHTGDLAKWQTDGVISCLGRMDEQVKIRGYRIELGEVESVIRTLPEIQDSAVIVRKDKSGEYAIHAYFVSQKKLDVADIRSKMSKILPEYMLPGYFMQIDEIPVNPNGKLDKRALPEINVKAAENYVAPTNDTERILCEAFAQILQVDKIGIYDHFFELGGNSIKAVKTVAELHKKNLEVSVRDLMLHPVIHELALLKMSEKPGMPEVERIYDTEEPDRTLNMSNTKVYQAVKTYQDNLMQAWVEKEYTPLKLQKQFWDRKEGNVCMVHMLVQKSVEKETVIQAIRNVINEQEVLRSVYDEKAGKIKVYALSNIEIPYCEERAEEMKRAALVLSLDERLEVFKDKSLLSYVFVQRDENGQYHVWFYAHHCIWDGMSDEILVNRMNYYMGCQNPEKLPQTYSEYVQSVQKAEKLSQMKEFWKRFRQASEEVHRNIRDRGEISCTVHGQLHISENEAEEFKENPLGQMIRCFAEYNELDTLKEIPVAILYHGRNDRNSRTLGMYLDLLPGIYNIAGNMTDGGEAWIAEQKENEYLLFTEYYEEIYSLPAVSLNYGGVFEGIWQEDAEEDGVDSDERSSSEIRASVTGCRLDITLPVIGLNREKAIQRYYAFVRNRKEK